MLQVKFIEGSNAKRILMVNEILKEFVNTKKKICFNEQNQTLKTKLAVRQLTKTRCADL